MMVETNKIWVAAYCRGSSLNSEEEDLLNNQIEHYTNAIQSNPAWQLAGIYSDSGKFETRPGFQKMIREAVGGGQYSYTSAIGLFLNVINFIMIITVNSISKRAGETSLF